MQDRQQRGFEIGKWYKQLIPVPPPRMIVERWQYMFVGGAMASPVNGTISLVGEVWGTGEKRLLASDPGVTEGWEECAPPKDAPAKFVNQLRENDTWSDRRIGEIIERELEDSGCAIVDPMN